MNEKSNALQDPVWDAAWAWVLLQHESGALSEALKGELEIWLSANPAHRKTYNKACKLWSIAGLVPPTDTYDLPADNSN